MSEGSNGDSTALYGYRALKQQLNSLADNWKGAGILALGSISMILVYFLQVGYTSVNPIFRLGDSYPGWKIVKVFVGNTTYGNGRQWYSQVGQDKTVCEIFELIHGHCKQGFFLDLAANDASSLSNTKALEDHYNWTGICIEANFEYTWGLAHRKCDVYQAIVSANTGDMVEFVEHPNGKPGWAGGIVSNKTDNKIGVNGNKVVRQATSLVDILHQSQAPTVVDYFSFDVEGAEDLILQKSVLEEYTFLVITVERPSQQLQEVLQRFGYEYLRDHGGFGDKMYVHSTMDKIQHVKSTFGS